MKFKIGEIVRHKLDKTKLVVVKYYPKTWLRKYPTYLCSYGESPSKMKDKKCSDYLLYYEAELTKLKGGKK